MELLAKLPQWMELLVVFRSSIIRKRDNFMKQKIIIGILVIGIAVFGVIIYSKKNTTNVLTYSFNGQVVSVDENKMVVRTSLQLPGQNRPSVIEKIVMLDSNTQYIKSSNSQNIDLSQIKGESLEYFPTQVNVYSYEDPATEDSVRAYKIEVTKDAKSTSL